MSVIGRIGELVHSAKVGAGVAASTVGAGISQALQVLPGEVLGTVAALLGITLSCVLIVTHIKRYLMDKRNSDIEYQLKIKQLEDKCPWEGSERRKEERP